MKTRRLFPLFLALSTLRLTPMLTADVLSFGLQDVPIPTNFEGIYINIDTGTTGNSSLSGWDINPDFGGARVYNSASFQPARTATGFEDPIVAFGAAATINGSLNYSTGFGASDSHLGNGANQFQPGSEAYMGFSLTTDAATGPHYGWARVVFTANQPNGVIKDWAYDNGVTGLTPNAIQTGNILRAPVSAGVSTVTLSGGAGQAPTLGTILTNPGGAVTAVTKSGAGSWTLSGNHTYTGQTSITGGTLEVGSTAGRLSGTSSVAINGGTLRLSGSSGVTDRINDAATMDLAGTVNTGGLSETIGALTLSGNSTFDLGSGASIFHYGASNGSIWAGGTLLTVANWSGSMAGGGTDQLFFGANAGGLTAGQLSQIRFDMGGGGFSGGAMLSSGELVPVPEPGAVVAVLGLLSLVGWRERKWFARCREPRS